MKLALTVLLLACAPPALAQTAAAPAGVKAVITMRDPSALEVSYAIAPGCPALEFLDAGMPARTVAELRRDWRPADDCTVIDGGRLRPARASCTTLRLQVPASNRDLDRVYPWAYPVGAGLYLHTADYALTGACGAVEWRFEAPGGTVVADGVVTAASATRAPGGGGDSMPVVLLRQPFRADAPRLHADPRFDAQTVALIDTSTRLAEREIKRELPDLPFTLPYVAAGVAAPGYWHGDMANRTIMRLAFQPDPGPALTDMLHGFISHEMSHMTQPVDWNDSWGEDDALIGEGGAELLRVATATHAGWYDRARMASDLEHAVNACVIAAAGKSWKSIPNRGRGKVPYDCGLTFYLVALGAHASAEAPLLRVRDYYRAARTGRETDFAQALECGGARACRPHWLARLAGAEPVDAVLLDAARQDGALFKVAAQWSPDSVATLAYRHVAQLMAGDCGGAVSIYQEPGVARIAGGPRCATLRADMRVVAAQGLPLFADGAALRASVAACRASGRTVLGLQDGGAVTLACDPSVDLPAQLFAVDAARAAALLRAPD